MEMGSNACDAKRRTVRESQFFEYLGSQGAAAADGGSKNDVVHRMNEGYKA